MIFFFSGSSFDQQKKITATTWKKEEQSAVQWSSFKKKITESIKWKSSVKKEEKRQSITLNCVIFN